LRVWIQSTASVEANLELLLIRLAEAFPAAEARRLVESFEWHYTPTPRPGRQIAMNVAPRAG
jgi:hypothetical protein